MPLNLPPQTSLFFERETICQLSIIDKWPHRHHHPVIRWHIRQDVQALRSMRAANVSFLIGQASVRHRTGGRTKRKQLNLI